VRARSDPLGLVSPNLCPKTCPSCRVIGLPQAQRFLILVLIQAQRILISRAFGFYRHLVTRIKPINSLIKLKAVFFTPQFQNFASACFMHDALSAHIHISNHSFPSSFPLYFPVGFCCLSSRSQRPHLHIPHIHKKRNYSVGEILTPYLPSPQLESGQTNAADTSEVVFPNF
jgi:hypothetical protein